MKNIKYIFILIILLTSSLSYAKVASHADPFPDEMLDTAIKLNCPISITEWRGSEINKNVIADMSEICRVSFELFPLFMESKGYKIIDSSTVFKASMIPDNWNYRSLNDTEFRFHTRVTKEVYGYTFYRARYIFITSDYNLDRFYEVWAHELFHAMSYIYQTFEQHSGNKLATDEKLAREFSYLIIS
jgi:hypothetical protein